MGELIVEKGLNFNETLVGDDLVWDSKRILVDRKRFESFQIDDKRWNASKNVVVEFQLFQSRQFEDFFWQL